MGHTQAEGMADAVAQGQLQRLAALHWHLTSNHFPPLPTSLVSTAQEAIEAAEDDLWDREIALPEGCSVNGHQKLPAWQVIEWLHLDSFIEQPGIHDDCIEEEYER